MFVNQTETRVIAVRNVGSAPTEFSVAVKIPGLLTSWLTVTPQSGRLEPNGTASLTATLRTLGVWAGKYRAWIVVESTALNSKVPLPVGLLVLCKEFANTDNAANRTVRFLADGVTTAHASIPPWNPPSGRGGIALGDSLWAEIKVRFSHPVKEVQLNAVRVSNGTLLEVPENRDRNAMCGDFSIRVQAPLEPWERSVTSICVEIQDNAILDIYGIPFPGAEYCVSIPNRPYGRLFGIGISSGGSGSVLPETSKSNMTVMAVFSHEIELSSITKEDFSVNGPPSTELMLQQVFEYAPYWVLLIQLPDNYFGEILVYLKPDNSIKDLDERSLMPVAPLRFKKRNETLVEYTAMKATFTPSMTNLKVS
uniref:Uncharacterized protein n=1 Tax=Tetraselmis sp. GSL018 TaxID=582737 RepID=A0A061S9H3_9CHLO